MFETIKKNLPEVIRPKQFHCLPAPFQEGTESNKDFSRMTGAMALSALVLIGIANTFNWACNVDTQYNRYRQRNG